MDYSSPDRDYLRSFEKVRSEPYSPYPDQHGERYVPSHIFAVGPEMLVEGLNQIHILGVPCESAAELKALALLVDYSPQH